VERLALIAPLKPGAETAAVELIAADPPFELELSGFERHTIYLSAGEVVFVFEGHQVEWALDALLDEPFNWTLSDAFERWRPLLDEPPRIAREQFSWSRSRTSEDASARTSEPQQSGGLSDDSRQANDSEEALDEGA
jgi:hypothetical protein